MSGTLCILYAQNEIEIIAPGVNASLAGIIN